MKLQFASAFSDTFTVRWSKKIKSGVVGTKDSRKLFDCVNLNTYKEAQREANKHLFGVK